jgi:hypothetical protein
MPVLPSGRRVEFSLDRFQAMLGRMPVVEAEQTIAKLHGPDDLLFVADVVLYHNDSGQAFFSGHLATDFEAYAAEWSLQDQDALAEWLQSDDALYYRAEAIDQIRDMVAEVANLAEYADHKPASTKILQAA